MNDKTNKKLSVKVKTYSRSRYTYPRNRQGGALLLGLIITMVIFGLLGGAMVYVLSSSSMDTVFGNFAQRAYYAAESGMRYVVATYRKALDDPTGRTNFQTLVDISDIPLNFPNDNGQATVTIIRTTTAEVETDVSSTTPPNTPIALSGEITISNRNGFPEKNGFFRIDADTNYYRYRTRVDGSGTLATLKVITGLGPWPKIVTGGTTKITSPDDQYYIKSVGHYGLFRRTVEYGWILSGIPPGTPVNPPSLPDLDDLVENNPFGNTVDLGRFVVVDVGGKAITVDQTTGGKAEAVLGYSADPNPLTKAWLNAGNFMSYDIQIKIATGVWSSGAFDKTLGGTDSVVNNGYIAGLTFRSTGINPGWWKQYGLDFAKHNRDGNFQTTMNPMIFPTLKVVASYPGGPGVGTSLIEKISGKDYQMNYICPTGTTCTIVDTDGKRGVGWVEYNPPMILLWTRNANQSSGFDHWLAFKLLENNEWVTEGADGLLKDWSTLMLRVVEGASLQFGIPLGSPTGFVVGETVTGQTSGATGKVFKKIQTVNGLNDVIILNNVVNGPGNIPFSTGEYIYSTSQTAIQNNLYRARDNYIWAMFGDTGAHPPVGTENYEIAIDNIRRANARLTDANTVDIIDNGVNIYDYIHWPPTNIEDWGDPDLSTTPVENDYFKLVVWNTNLNKTTNGDPNMLIMGTGQEAGAILRTSLWTTVAYTSAPFPYEVGFHSLGDTATKTYFDDLALNFPGQTLAGGINYVPPVQN
ncbi:MAG: pilus assembly PilX N-terminal domain-containing protein [Pseudomonadota bacterium]